MALESLEEHHVVKWMLSELEGMDPEDERFDAKVTVLIENVRHHVREEESEYFREVRSELGSRALNELGEAMAKARETAPTRPHPRLSDAPPGNIPRRHGGERDRSRRQHPQRGRAGRAGGAHDLVDRVRGERPRRSSPTGPSVTRRTARSVRGDADVVVERVIASVVEAKASAQQVARDARFGAARTAKAARGAG
jgi:hypothetical protein